jgi:hypothetical protein
MEDVKKVYYSIRNGGDGSANIILMESEELVDFDQEHIEEWGEPCCGSIDYIGDIVSNIITKEEYLLDYMLGYKPDVEEIKEFLEKFFPNGTPSNFIVEEEESVISKNYKYNNIYLNKRFISKSFKTIEKSGSNLENLINNFKIT